MPEPTAVSNHRASKEYVMLRLFHHFFPIFEAWLHVIKPKPASSKPNFLPQ